MNVQFRPDPELETLPTGAMMLVDYVARDRAFRGIGPARGEALFRMFGEGMLRALATPCETVIDMIGEEAALCAASVVRERAGETFLVEWVSNLSADIPSGLVARLARAWGDQGIDAVRDNPYLLLAVAAWKHVDVLAKAAGISETDMRRETASIEAVLQGPAGLEGGTTRLTEDHVIEAAAELLGRPLSDNAIERCIATGGAIRVGEDLQPPGAAWMEAEVAQIISGMSAEAPRQDLGAVCLSDEEISTYLDQSTVEQGFPFTAMQRAAVLSAHRNRVFTLGGYAGSGKTTVLRGICATIETVGRRPVIITLSGRAAKRAAEATGRAAMTVAKFLVLCDRNEVTLSAADTVIVDEASMLSLVDVWRILRRLGDASLIMAGDPAQLPPIGFGLVFHTLVENLRTPSIILDRVMRQSSESGIPAVAEAVRRGRPPRLPDFDASLPGVSFIPCRRTDLCAIVSKVGKDLRKAGLDRDDMQIIAPTHEDIDIINQHFHDITARRSMASWPGRRHICEGEPIIWTQNDPDRGLTNGSMGRISSIIDESIFAQIDGHRHFLNADDHSYIQLAYAISVHKAQGSQWPCVIVPIFHSQIVDRSLIYTALTRAQTRVVFVGDGRYLRKAVRQPSAADRRRTALETWLNLVDASP